MRTLPNEHPLDFLPENQAGVNVVPHGTLRCRTCGRTAIGGTRSDVEPTGRPSQPGDPCGRPDATDTETCGGILEVTP